MKKSRRKVEANGTQIDRYPKGKKRIESVLKAARRIFVKQGYAGCTMRNIAKQSGTTVGNLQHFFPNKSKLLHDLLEYTVHDFLVGFEAIINDPDKTGEEKLIAYIGTIFDAFPTEEKTKFYPEFWALSNHNKHAAKLLEDLYENGLVPLIQIINEINPKLTKREQREIAISIVGWVEGSVVFVGYQRSWSSSFNAVRRTTIEACLHIIKSHK